MLVGQMVMKLRGVTCHYTAGKSERTTDKLYTIIAPTDITLEREALAYSPFIYDTQFMSPGFDFEDIDISQVYTIKCQPVKFFFI